jgi:hypothetical protein
MLKQMGFKNDGGVVKADLVKKHPSELASAIEDEKIACLICGDGKKYKPNEMLGYVFFFLYFDFFFLKIKGLYSVCKYTIFWRKSNE